MVLDSTFPVSYQDFEVEHRFLPQQPDGSRARIRRRTQAGVSHFNLTLRNASNVELRQSITGREYDALMRQADPHQEPIVKKRRCFLWENRYFQLDRFLHPREDLVILEAYFSKSQAKVPPFIPVLKDVTQDGAYSMKNISKKSKK
jgi:CYTH domain-containing protein